MGWCTDLFCNISFNRETFNSRSEVQDRLKETEVYLQNAKDQLRNLVMMTEPQKFCPENYDPMIWLNGELQDLFELIEEYSIEIYKLSLLLENWDKCHNEEGLAIEPPSDIHWDTAFLDGDFVRTTSCPNANDISRFENE